ncbi:MAG: ABC transporter ATP-binding protein [Clostridia bacterium]|nr:ABC transporter ATP-binding protein [Clostridia bacterium]
MNVIETDSLTKYYGKSRGIIDLNIEVGQGEFLGFVGPNGAGKSTAIRTLLGLISPTSGSASVLGLDIGKSRTEILSRVGYLPSETAFYNGMRVSEVLELSARLRGIDCTKEAAVLCERLQLDKTKKIRQLSLGNRKKVGIVCALQHLPELYILDEPTSGLDPLMQQEFYNILKERNSQGATVFLSSHILSEVARYCGRAVIIREGRIIAADTLSVLSAKGFRRVTLKGANVLPLIDGISEVRREDSEVTFAYRGEAGKLIRALSDLEFDDITITEPSLDEIFMDYYTAEEGHR